MRMIVSQTWTNFDDIVFIAAGPRNWNKSDADGPQTAGLVIQPFQAVAKNIFIWLVRRRTALLAGQAVFPCFTGVSHFTCDIRWTAGADKLTVNHALDSRYELIVHCLISGGSYKCNVEC